MKANETNNEVKGPGVMLCVRDASGMAEQLSAMAKDLATNAIEQRRLALAAIELLQVSGDMLSQDLIEHLEDARQCLADEDADGGNGDAAQEAVDEFTNFVYQNHSPAQQAEVYKKLLKVLSTSELLFVVDAQGEEHARFEGLTVAS